jgi:uncharacterized membrane protein
LKHHRLWRRPASSSVQLATVGFIGALVGVPVSVLYSPTLGPLIGWDVAALVYVVWAWIVIWPLDPRQTARLAVRGDPNRPLRDVLLLVACLASLVAVGFVLATARGLRTPAEELHIGIGVVSILLSWTVVHTVFTARYARLYYSDPAGGIDYHQSEPPRYSDFAYTAFTIGVTFQVSDNELNSAEMRRTVLAHALVSYLFGAVIIGATINLIAGLAR